MLYIDYILDLTGKVPIIYEDEFFSMIFYLVSNFLVKALNIVISSR